MGFHLVIVEGGEAGKEFVFDQASVVIGRTSDCDITLHDSGVSRKHARIHGGGEAYFVEDMGSSNGTNVNGSAVKKHRLADGDRIALGPVVLSFTSRLAPVTSEVDTEPGQAKTVPPQALARGEDTGVVKVNPPRRSIKLPAAEKARIRRESKGILGDLRIFWLEASALTRAALSLLVVGAGLGVVGLVYLAATGGGPAAPERPEPARLSRTPIEDSFGLGPGVTWHRPDMKVFVFDFTAPLRAVVLVHFQAKDIAQGEVVVTVNGADVGAVPPDTLQSAEKSHELIVPSSVLKKGEPNQLIFDSTKNPPGNETWRIWNVWVEVAPLPEIPPDLLLIEANQKFQRAQLLFDRRDVGAENRYQAWKEYRNVWLMLEGHPEPRPELYLLARDKVREAQQELDRTCAKLLLEEETHYHHKNWKGARATLDHVKQYFPGNDQPCVFRAEQKRYEHGLQDW